MRGQIPDHVIKQYGSARAFRAHKRRLVRQMRRLLNDLRLGCAYFPEGSHNVEAIGTELEILTRVLSVKGWGR